MKRTPLLFFPLALAENPATNAPAHHAESAEGAEVPAP